MTPMQANINWSVWIDEERKVVSVNEIPKGKKVNFKTREIGLEYIMILIGKGYKIG